MQTAEKRREEKGKGEKERYSHLNAEFQRIARRDQKAFLSDQCIGEGNDNPLQCLAWRIPGMEEPGGLLSMGLHRVGHD